MPVDAQVCNCNGVSKGAIGACVAAGRRSPKLVMEATRGGHGLWLVQAPGQRAGDLVLRRQVEDDPSVHYYVPTIPLAKQELATQIRARGLTSVSSVFAALAGGKEDPGSKPALASLLAVVWKGEHAEERDARFINDRVHANIQKDGTFSVVPEMPGGVCSSDELRRIADVADKYRVPLIKLTGGQRIDLVGVKKEDLPGIWRDLGMPAGYAWAKSYRTCKSCIGVDYCRYGLGDSMDLALKIEQRFRGLESPGKLKLATAGCPRNCSEALVKDVGAVAVEGGKWEIYVGGAAGAHVRKGDLLCVVDSHDDVLRVSGRFIQYYRETREVQGAHLHASSSAWASNASGRSSSTTANASAPISIASCRNRSTRRCAIPGRSATRLRRRTSSERRCRCWGERDGHAPRAGPGRPDPAGAGAQLPGRRAVGWRCSADATAASTRRRRTVPTAAARWRTACWAAARWSARCTNGDSIS